MPDGAYSPVAPRGGKDEYRCFLLDPELAEDTFVTGAEVLPGRVEIVHHAIIFRVGPDEVATAEQADQGDPGTGWTCFGGTAFPGRGGANVVSALDSAPWLSAWAPGGGENVFGPGTGVLLEAGSRLVLQVHYNLRNGAAPDDSGLRLRLADGTADLEQLQTMLLVAPVELPCAKGETGTLCDRETAVLDLMQRFGAGSGATVAGLQLLCDGNVAEPRAGSDPALRPAGERARWSSAPRPVTCTCSAARSSSSSTPARRARAPCSTGRCGTSTTSGPRRFPSRSGWPAATCSA